MEEVKLTLDEYKELIFCMKYAIDRVKFRKKGYVIPFPKVKVTGSFLKRYENTGFFDYKELGDDLYEFTLTIKGTEYLSSILQDGIW